MNLEDFISETLYQIGAGVQKAKFRAKDFVAIAPTRVGPEEVSGKTDVQFDIALVVKDSTSGEIGKGGTGSAELAVASILKISAGGNLSNKENVSNASEATHRIAFSVPVYLAAHFRGDPGTVGEAEAFELALAKSRTSSGVG